MLSFMNNINIGKNVSTEQKNKCDAPLTLAEIKMAISNLKNNKSPGVDGLIAEYYKTFSDLLTR